ncbi:MAG: TRAM domain-containing protein, partial [Nitrospirales bacterium]
MLSSDLKINNPRGVAKNTTSVPVPPVPVTSEVLIEKLVSGGDGLGRVGAQVVFVKGGLPEEQLRIHVHAKRRGVHYGNIINILQPARDRVVPPCSIYGQCGGCQLQHLSYLGQLQQKRAILIDALQRIGKIEIPEIGDVVASPHPLGYRS